MIYCESSQLNLFLKMNNLFKPKQQSESSARGSLSGFMNKVKAKVTTQKEQVEIAQEAVQKQTHKEKVQKLEKSPDYKFQIDDDDEYDDEEDGSPEKEKPQTPVHKAPQTGEMMSDSSSDDGSGSDSSGDG